jgi:Xaa-Pro dipeptidase
MTPSTHSLMLASTPRPPAPGIAASELQDRLARIRQAMADTGIDFIILSDRKNVDYVTDYASLSWAYKARPIFAVVSSTELWLFGSLGESVNVALKPRHFTACYYDGYLPEAVDAIAARIQSAGSLRAPHIAVDYGQEMLGRGSLEIIERIGPLAAAGRLKSAVELLWQIRMIKTPTEVALKRIAFEIVNDAFDRTIAEARLGVPEYELCQRMQAQIFLNGAESADPIAMLFSSGDFAYGRPPSTRRLAEGHYIWTDFRATYGGYPADKNRTARAGEPLPWEREAYTKMRDMTLELANGVRPGMTCSELYGRFRTFWARLGVGEMYRHVSRIGHGGGLDVTEPPSIAANDDTIIRPGMILHIEPKLERDGAIFQFEEVFHVTDDGIEFISALSPAEIPVVLQ